MQIQDSGFFLDNIPTSGNVSIMSENDTTEPVNQRPKTDIFQSEEKRIRFLAELKNILNQNGGRINYEDRLGLIDILSQAFTDKLSSSRCTAMDILCQIIPAYGYELDTHIGMLFPQLVQNLLHRNSSVKKCALQTLHIYCKHSLNKSIISDYLIQYGIKNERKSIRNEVLLALPALIPSGFSDEQLCEMYQSVLQSSKDDDNNQSSLPTVLCLQHIKESLSEQSFEAFFNTLEDEEIQLYNDIMTNSSYVRATSGVSEQRSISSSLKNNVEFGFLPRHIFEKLDKNNSWHERTEAMNSFLSLVMSPDIHETVLIENCQDLLEYLNILVDDINFNVSLTALNIIHKVVTRIHSNSKKYLQLILDAFIKKMNDPKIVVRRINLRIALSLMHSLSPSYYIQSILPYLKHKNTCVREETLNTITAALLSFPSSDFDLEKLPQQLAFTLTDPKRKIRHSSLECFSILAQQLGAGRLTSLVAAVNTIESSSEGKGVLIAVQARLHRKILPSLDDDGLVRYALSVPVNTRQENNNLQPDILWIVSGAISGINTPKSKSDDSLERQRFSAGKKKLPWSNKEKRSNSVENGSHVTSPREKASSAPARQLSDENNSPRMREPQDAWVSVKGEKDSKKDSTYFDMYKTRMKKLKQAGLQADANTLNSVHPTMGLRNTLPSNLRDVKQFEIAYKKGQINRLASPNSSKPTSPSYEIVSPLSPINGFAENSEVTSASPTEEIASNTPIPVKATLARSAGKSGRKRSSLKKDDHEKNISPLPHTLPRMKGSAESRRLSLESPFPSRPTIYRSPSGRILQRPDELPLESPLSNLISMKTLSSSSPVLERSKKTPVKSPDIRSSSALTSPDFFSHSPMIRQPHACTINSSRMKSTRSVSPNTSSENERDILLENFTRDKILNNSRSPRDQLSPDYLDKLTNHRKPRRLMKTPSQNSLDLSILKNEVPKTKVSQSLDLDVVGTEVPKPSHQPVLQKKSSRRQNSQQEIPFDKNKSVSPVEMNKKEVINYDDIPIKSKYTQSLSNGLDAHQNDLSNDDSETFHPKVIKKKSRDRHLFNENEIDNCKETVVSDWSRLDTPDLHKENAADSNNNIITNAPSLLEEHNDCNQMPPPKEPPRIVISPKARRKPKSISTTPDVESNEKVSVRSYTDEDLDKPLDRPQQSFHEAIELLGKADEHWENKCDGLLLVRRLARHHADILNTDFNVLIELILKEVKSLRSQVSRSALSATADLITYVPRLIETELDATMKIVLPRAADTNQFIKSDVEFVMKCLGDNITQIKAISVIFSQGLNHRNPLVRKACGKSLSDICERTDPCKLVVLHKDFLPMIGKLSTDSQPDARYHGRRILYHIRDYPNLDRLLEKQLPSANQRPVKDILDNIRAKGLPDPPTGSATLRKSLRNPSPMRSPGVARRTITQPPIQEKVNSAKQKTLSSSQDPERMKKKKQRSRENAHAGTFQASLETLNQLDSTNWNDRYEGLDEFYELVSLNPSGVSSNAVKVFDKLCPRLSDSNSKVSLYALQTLNRCVPILRNGMSPTMPMIIDNLKTPLSSNNDGIFTAAKDCLATITKYIDPVHLIVPFSNALQYGNTRNKPELAERLADVVMPVYARKPGLIQRHVMPVLWSLLSTSSSGVQTPGRANLQSSISRMCSTLYECMGEQLLDDASNKSPRALQRIEAILGR